MKGKSTGPRVYPRVAIRLPDSTGTYNAPVGAAYDAAPSGSYGASAPGPYGSAGFNLPSTHPTHPYGAPPASTSGPYGAPPTPSGPYGTPPAPVSPYVPPSTPSTIKPRTSYGSQGVYNPSVLPGQQASHGAPTQPTYS
ncbi:hypothetical protein RSOLAG1IB_11316 [Rhizoctonia solani AG-1 IB]|uniref:Uncharacterized protein n=1 Tax=Thanatephorus cucumeris (strain AG1-IB / isolate 7/3/14) TaxID=1108050 RepID=A0A0B7F8Z6_THACB|nr:hypothetical protein RSOLAG1IB_11316 [Rhizoctonia solani AG-1 IB]